MQNIFSLEKLHKVCEANTNYYSSPFTHPKRNMQVHDFIFLLEGGWKLGQNGEEFELKKDSLLILSAGNTHYGISPCARETKTMYFHVERNENDGAINLSPDKCFVLNSLIDTSGNRTIRALFSEVVNSKLSGDQRKADLYFELLLCELAKKSDHSEDISVADRIKNIIHSNPEKFFSNKELADMTNVSTKTAEIKFKSLFGMTIHQYMLNFKIKEAVSYFELFPDISIKETAYNLGFYDEYHFSKQFKKSLGISPKAYKDKLADK